jgi:hypothetical protein
MTAPWGRHSVRVRTIYLCTFSEQCAYSNVDAIDIYIGRKYSTSLKNTKRKNGQQLQCHNFQFVDNDQYVLNFDRQEFARKTNNFIWVRKEIGGVGHVWRRD